MELKQDDTGQAIVPVLACVLNQLCQRNDRLPMSQKGVSKFHALRPPQISIKDYLGRIAKYAACSGECFVLALVYIDRIIQSNPTFVVNSLNIHRLLITSVMLAAKFFDDQYYNNAYYAKVGGVPCPEMNLLEVEFLFMTNFTLFVTTDTYRQYYTELCNHARSTACGCSTQRVPTLYIPADKFGELGYRYDDDSTEAVDDESQGHGQGGQQMQQAQGMQSGNTNIGEGHSMVTDSPAVPPRRLPTGNSNPGQGQMLQQGQGQGQGGGLQSMVSPTYQQQQQGNVSMQPSSNQQQGGGSSSNTSWAVPSGTGQQGMQQGVPFGSGAPGSRPIPSRQASTGHTAGRADMITGSPPVNVRS